MSSSNANREKLFAKTVPVSITDGSFTNLRSLFLSIEWQQTATMKKELFITLTDNSDPFFLYDLQLSDDDFQRLKSSQNLLMDFSAFPQTVIHFLELCLNEAKESQPNYLLHLIKGERVGNIPPSAQLDIEQSSVFRQVSLLSLKFFAATDSTITQHVTIGFRNLKEENQRLQNQLCHLENNFRAKVSDLESALEKKSQELENVKRELNAEIDKRESWHSQMLREEREKLLNKQREGENRLESERIDRETKLKRDIEHLEARVSCLERLNKELENKKTELERQLSALRSHNLSVETDLRLKSEALTNAERKNSELIADFKESSGRINHLMGNIKDLNETLKRKEKQIDGLQRDLDNSKKEKKKIASGLSAAEEQLDKEKKARKEVEHEHLKAIQIIAKYQDTNKALIKKTTKLEGTSNKQEQEIQYLENELKRESNTNQRLAIEIEQIRVYQETIGKLEGENRKLNLYNSEITKLLHENNLILEYRPPPCFAENFPICEVVKFFFTFSYICMYL
nr:spindle assembly abnormal protein 6 homolog isoform X2 [Parasteatoda tepidariorum]